jgi:hypothetical protein
VKRRVFSLHELTSFSLVSFARSLQSLDGHIFLVYVYNTLVKAVYDTLVNAGPEAYSVSGLQECNCSPILSAHRTGLVKYFNFCYAILPNKVNVDNFLNSSADMAKKQENVSFDPSYCENGDFRTSERSSWYTFCKHLIQLCCTPALDGAMACRRRANESAGTISL